MGIRSQSNPEQSFNDVFANTGIEAVSPAPVAATITGGTKTTYSGKTIHTFIASGAFTLDGGPLAIEYVIIGGGASGGSNGTNAYGTGGGGAGQVRTGTTTVADASMTITIGAGGATAAAQNTQGNDGTNSSAAFPSGTITGYGGGGGAANGPPTAYSPGRNGVNYPSPTAGSGSGGGAGRSLPGITYNGGPAPLGAYPGGQGGHAGQYAGCGGGGAGGAGGDGPPTSGSVSPTTTTIGYGGLALQLPTTFRDPNTAPTTGTPGPSGTHWVAGGGSAGLYSNPTPATVNAAKGGAGPGGGGPYGGGGNGGSATSIDGTAAADNTGGGGGGGGSKVPEGGDGGAGGSGLILIAYDS